MEPTASRLSPHCLWFDRYLRPFVHDTTFVTQFVRLLTWKLKLLFWILVGHEPTFLGIGELCYSVECCNLLGCLSTDGLPISTLDGFPRFGRHFSIRAMHQLLRSCSGFAVRRSTALKNILFPTATRLGWLLSLANVYTGLIDCRCRVSERGLVKLPIRCVVRLPRPTRSSIPSISNPRLLVKHLERHHQKLV